MSVQPHDVSGWADEQLLAAVDFQLPADDDQRLSALLTKQRDEILSPADMVDLRALMATYQQRLLQKSVALREAVCRELRPAPTS